jgi:hypothetical protein
MVTVKYCKHAFFEADEIWVGIAFCLELPVLVLPDSILVVPDFLGNKQFHAICIPWLHIELGTDGLTVTSILNLSLRLSTASLTL